MTNHRNRVKYRLHAEVAEQADALRSGRSSLHGSVGSTPTFGTNPSNTLRGIFFAYLLYFAMQLQCLGLANSTNVRYYTVSKRQGAPLTLAFAF